MEVGEKTQRRRGENLGVAGPKRRLDRNPIDTRRNRSRLRNATSRGDACACRPTSHDRFQATRRSREPWQATTRGALQRLVWRGACALLAATRGFCAARFWCRFAARFLLGRSFLGRQLLRGFFGGSLALL